MSNNLVVIGASGTIGSAITQKVITTISKC